MSLQKKIEKAYAKGFNDACDIWEDIVLNTKGIGPTLKARIIDNVHKKAKEISDNKR